MSSKLPEPLTSKDPWAYKSLTSRFPVIITKVIDLLCRQRREIPMQLGLPKEDIPKAEEETKVLIEELAKLKYELQTNKPFKLLDSVLPDAKIYNDFYENAKKHYSNVSYFDIPWLYSECYFYRMMHEVFVKSKYFKNFDHFSSVKQDSFINCIDMASKLSLHLKTVKNKTSKLGQEEVFNFYTMTSLWGNKVDLSISCGDSEKGLDIDFKQLQSMVLVNESPKMWLHVQNISKKSKYQIDLVLDNAGYELFTDLCWLEAMHSIGIFPKDKGKVNIYVKKMPWFVSDTMTPDIKWLSKYIDEHPKLSQDLREINNCFKENFTKGIWLIEEDYFWTLPHDFAYMPTVAPKLYENLCKSDLIIFKGDLNYRKLVGDLKWDFRTPFKKALREFQPTSCLASLRTVKSNCLAGITDEKIFEKTLKFPSDWVETGDYAVLHFVDNTKK